MSFPDPQCRPGQDCLSVDDAMPAGGAVAEPAAAARDAHVFEHSLAEDVQGMVIASLVASLGLAIFAHGGIMVGGMAGVSFLLHYGLGWNFGLVFVLVNLPFYWIAVRRMGWEFTLKTFAAVAVVGLLTDLLPRWADWAHMDRWFSAVAGGALCGLGILFFIRHRASLGGIGILAVHLQQSRGISAGTVQLVFDGVLMAIALCVLSPANVLYSALGAVVLSLVLMFNHRPYRYMGV
jgi:uncharacterized membrane-anchored protein YitT (DUF2179 family)